MKVKIIKVEAGSWYKKVGEIFEVESKISEGFITGAPMYLLQKDTSRGILERNCVIIDSPPKYPTLSKEYNII